MTSTLPLRSAIVGLLSFAHGEEELLLSVDRAAATQPGTPDCWAASPLIAHNTEFKRQQVQRLTAILRGQVPPDFDEVDHGSAAVYRRYGQQPAGQVRTDSREVTSQLIDGLAAIDDDDLLIPDRNPWLKGRQLGLQLIVRGFWHPTGHLGDYYLGHGQPDRACALHAHAAATAEYLRAPAPARGMAYFNLACAQARAERPGPAVAALRQAIELNPALRAKASGDADLAVLRETGQLAPLLS